MVRKIVRIASLTGIAIVLVMYSLSAGASRDSLVYRESLDEVAVTVDGRPLTLEDLAFYVVYEENSVERDAEVYDKSNTNKYWSIHTNGSFLKLSAKDAALGMAVHDEIFYRLAVQYNLSLEPSEQRYLENEIYDFLSDLKEGQLDRLGITEEQLGETMAKIALANKYQSILSQAEGEEYAAYDFTGEAYGKLLEEHEIHRKDAVWNRVAFGNVTLEH